MQLSRATRWPLWSSAKSNRAALVAIPVHLFTRCHCQRQTILWRRQRASGEIREHTRRIFGFIEIDFHPPGLLHSALGHLRIEEARCAVGGLAAGLIAHYE